MRTRIEVDATGPALHVDLEHGLLHARRVRSSAGVRIALVAGQALLLAGDEVDVSVVVRGPVSVEITEPAGTVAYDMRDLTPARWDVSVAASEGARVEWHGEPFVVAAGASVTRSTSVSVDDTSVVWLRETVILGRTGQTGGRLVSAYSGFIGGRPALVETLDLTPGRREGWAVLGDARCLDSVTVLGERLPAKSGTGSETAGFEAPELQFQSQFRTEPLVLQLDEVGSVARWRGYDAHRSPLLVWA